MLKEIFLCAGLLIPICVQDSEKDTNSNSNLYPITNSEGKGGYIDSNGKIIIEPKFDTVGFFHEGYAQVRIKELWGYINIKGEIILEPQEKTIFNFSDGLAKFWESNKTGFFDTQGKVALDPIFEGASDFHEGLSFVKKGEKWGYMDKNAKIIIEPQYEPIVNAGDFTEGLACVKKGVKYGFIDKNGKEVVPIKFDGGGNFCEGLARVNIGASQLWIGPMGGKWGYINKEGALIIEPKFDEAGDFIEGLAKVGTTIGVLNMQTRTAEMTTSWKFIDKKGETVLNLEGIESVKNFSNGICGAKKNGKWGFIDKSGEFVIEPVFDAISDYDGSLIYATYEQKRSYLNRKGEVIWKEK